jgi:cytochrome c
MKRFFLVACPLILSAACGSSNDSGKPARTQTADITKDPDYQKGLQLEVANDCKTCHMVETRITGPSFREIADKYAGYPDTIVSHLADKVIKGGTGVWGQALMLPHTALSKEDAEAMVKYILLLKTQK